MRNTTIADMIKGIQDMDRTLAMPKRTGLSKLRKADLVALHSEVLDHFLKVTQPEVDALLAEKFYACEPCGGTNVLIACRDEHDRQNHTEPSKATQVEALQEFVPLRTELRQKRDKITTAPATGPAILVVVKVGRKLEMGYVISTVSRPMAMDNKNLVAVRHLSDLGYPRVTLHAPKDVAV